MLLYLDAYHLGDPLFLTGLARDLKSRGGGAVLVHGSGERGERALESLGHLARREGGIWHAPDAEAAAAIEASTRDLNREIAHGLNEAGVASVRVIGADRGLLHLGEEGVRVGKTEWVATLVSQGVVVVVASLAAGQEGGALREVFPAAAAGRLALGLDVPVALLASTRIEASSEVDIDRVAEFLPDPEAARRLLEMGAEVVVLERPALRTGGGGAVVRAGGAPT